MRLRTLQTGIAGLAVLTCALGSFGPARAQVSECDRLTASSDDPDRPAAIAPVTSDQIKTADAIAACMKALEDRPGDARIKFQLARALLREGERLELAARLFREAGEAGHTVAMSHLGYLYSAGRGVPRKDEQAVRWFRRAAEAGSSYAMNNLGVLLSKGRGIKRNYQEAFRWYRRAAEVGNPDAMNNLGFMLNNGLGVPRNVDEARYWYRKAAELGHHLARENLAELAAASGRRGGSASSATSYRDRLIDEELRGLGATDITRCPAGDWVGCH